MGKTVLAVLIFASGLAAAETLSEKWAKRIEPADAAYQTAIKKADDARSTAVRKATFDHVRVLKTAVSDATKAGDFTAAKELQSRLEESEAAGTVDSSDTARGKPHFLSALYGVNQSWSDVTDKMNAMLTKKGAFPLIVTDELFGDPEPQYEGGNTLVTRFVFNGKIYVRAAYVGREFNLR